MKTKAKTIAPAMATLASALLVTSAATANPNRYDAAEIKQSIIGKRIYLAVPFGGEFPNYRVNGQVDGSGGALGLGNWQSRPTPAAGGSMAIASAKIHHMVQG